MMVWLFCPSNHVNNSVLLHAREWLCPGDRHAIERTNPGVEAVAPILRVGALRAIVVGVIT